MVLIGDMHSVFVASRILGSSNHVIVEDNIKKRKPLDVVHVVLSMVIYISSMVILHTYVFTYASLDVKGAFLSYGRVALFYSCFFTDATLTVRWNWKLRSFLSQLRNFDRATKFDNSSKRVKVRNICRVTVFFTWTYWAVVGYLSYRIEKRLPVIHGLAYAVIDAAVCMQVLVFVSLSYLIEERFRQLCNLLTLSMGEPMVPDRLDRRFTMQQIWWLHCTLVNATETLNSVYGVQLLLWISSMSLNAMSRIYTLNMYTLTEFGKCRESLLAIICWWNLLMITGVCHVTAQQANRIGEIIFAPSFSASTRHKFLRENLEAAAYFQQRKVHFYTVAGFVRVDLPLLLSIVSSMTTYLVILC
ncbi:uncharacterized protein LOC128889805 [Hylaeus anthracinus]|uniref:uncharacterized protein LOC128889805 n=1 Tax=Hylaeus anthracinus TaxID=313031 RepID=UPI0023B8B81C|nr:uncharacterized protein LOC128889805 [Hylaeus anthracinus]